MTTNVINVTQLPWDRHWNSMYLTPAPWTIDDSATFEPNSSRDTYLYVYVTFLSYTGIAFIILVYAATLRNRLSSGQEPEQNFPQQQSEDINSTDLVCRDIDKEYTARDIVLEIAADRLENSNSKTLLVDFSSDDTTQEPYVVIHSASLLKCDFPADHIATTNSLVTLI